jgi:serine/threonine protein kinase
MSEPQQIGRYQVLEELGRGGMGRVVKAEDPTIRRQVAIKLIRLNAGSPQGEQELFERSFLREIRSAGVLHHPGIISIFDAGRQDDLAYIVMELVDGVTLEAMLQQTPRPDMSTLLGICRQVAVALDYAHGRGIVHRDIKPANVLIGLNGMARIADFGIAKLSHKSTLSFGKTAVAGGTMYMSPELITGQPLDGRSDQWSLAAMLYNVLTGMGPFSAENIAVLLGQIMSLDPMPPSSVIPGLPFGTDAVLAKAFSKDPARRYSSCVELMDALEVVLSSLPGGEPAPEYAETAEVRHDDSTGAAPPARKRSRGKLIAAAAAGLFTMVAGVMFLALRQSGPQPDAPPFTVDPLRVTPPRPSPFPPSKLPRAKKEPPAQAVRVEQPAVKAPPKLQQVQVHFVTTPPDAQVIVDSRRGSGCKSPCSMELTEGAHALLLQKDGFRSILQNFTVSPSHPEVAIALNELTGSLLVQSDPPGAAIALNGKPRSETTPATLNLPAGKYKVTVTKAGFAPSDFETSVLADSVREVSVGLAESQ